MGDERVLIIAEAGVNHNGSLDMARALIDAAAVAGADVVKFQTFSADRLVDRDSPKAEYQKRNSASGETQHAMLKKLELSEADHFHLLEYCGKAGIEFFSTAFDLHGLAFLDSLGFKRHKIPSGEITNKPYLEKVGSLGKEVILSTGMADLGEVEAALRVLEASGTPRHRITVLHCTTEYPAPKDQVNLRAMLTLRDAFGVRVGYSDHTEGIEIAIAAVALGATVVEKHFTLDRNLPGPDHKASLEPEELKSLVQAIRNTAVSLGNGIKAPTDTEIANRAIARKSLVATRKIQKGERITREALDSKRPGTGFSPMRMGEVVGLISPHDFEPGEMIRL